MSSDPKNEFEKIVPARLGKLLRAGGSSLTLFCVKETGSTNVDAAKMLAAGTPPGNFALVAETQTAGRGRIGRRWESSASGNIYLSCGFRPDIAPEKLSNFTLWLGVAVAEMLCEKFGVPARVKWPNDIFCRGKKLAGMLTEAHADARRARGIVFGLGLNVNLDPTTLPPAVRTVATSLRAEIAAAKAKNSVAGTALDASAVCAETILAVERAYAKFLAGTHTDALLERWNRFDWLAGKNVVALFGNEEISGTASGIDAQGRIQILRPDGTVVAFSAGDVLLKKN